MIEVTRLKGTKIIINAELIEIIEETPDTVITLTSGKKYIVSETKQDVVNLVISYKRKIYAAYTA
ncbi:MAG: flagellar protein FlbD [Lachnospiraceae bacterium]|nr:flagellar protein FlbD [Lachnospiraceae bacterium]